MSVPRFETLEKDYYLVDEQSDDEGRSISSEEDFDSALAEISSHEASKEPTLSETKASKKKDQDEFVASMEAELDAQFQSHQSKWIVTNVAKSKGSMPKHRREDVDPSLGLDDKDEDSDEEFCRQEGMTKPSDEDLFYDPDEDDANEDWVTSHRRVYQPKGNAGKPLPHSDAVLNCPACMTVLCMDCQRHEVYKTQYRAMFTLNCDVQMDKVVDMPLSKRQIRKRKSAAGQSSDVDMNSINPKDKFHPVLCSICKTEVAMFDHDEVYHFYNVLASYS